VLQLKRNVVYFEARMQSLTEHVEQCRFGSRRGGVADDMSSQHCFAATNCPDVHVVQTHNAGRCQDFILDILHCESRRDPFE
jgi:hypothetical protein